MREDDPGKGEWKEKRGEWRIEEECKTLVLQDAMGRGVTYTAIIGGVNDQRRVGRFMIED